MKELKFIAGVFFDFELPKERKFLFKYFHTEIERKFLQYYYCFGELEMFTDHTGMHCQKKWLKLILKKHDVIIQLLHDAREANDEALVAKIESGKMKNLRQH